MVEDSFNIIPARVPVGFWESAKGWTHHQFFLILKDLRCFLPFYFSHHCTASVHRVQRGVLSFLFFLLSFFYRHSPVEITLIVILFFFPLFTVQTILSSQFSRNFYNQQLWLSLISRLFFWHPWGLFRPSMLIHQTLPMLERHLSEDRWAPKYLNIIMMYKSLKQKKEQQQSTRRK